MGKKVNWRNKKVVQKEERIQSHAQADDDVEICDEDMELLNSPPSFLLNLNFDSKGPKNKSVKRQRETQEVDIDVEENEDSDEEQAFEMKPREMKAEVVERLPIKVGDTLYRVKEVKKIKKTVQKIEEDSDQHVTKEVYLD